jgi:hypothetical protein
MDIDTGKALCVVCFEQANQSFKIELLKCSKAELLQYLLSENCELRAEQEFNALERYAL